MIDPIPEPAVWPPTVELRRDPASQERHRAALAEVLRRPAPTPPKPYRGIVYVGGGKYWPGIVVGVKLLRELGCTLPVEVWHRACEPVHAPDVYGLNVHLVDADHVASDFGDQRITYGNEYTGGWEAKLYALTHTGFEQVLFLDADAYCVADPGPLFDLLSPAEPFVFWQDMPRCETSVDWKVVWPDGPAGVPPVQGGQLLLDRRYAAKLLDVAHWMCQHSDFYFCWMYGDQDAWRVALASGHCGGYRNLGPADWEQPAFVCRHAGTPYVVHRCQGKLFPEPAPVPNPELPREARVFELFRSLAS